MAMLPRRVLSMDGGGVMSLLTLELLKRIESQRPGFLASIDVFAGTSAGGINALIMASHENPADGIDVCIDLWNSEPIYDAGLMRQVSAIAGACAFAGNNALHKCLESALGSVTLGDLHRFVLIPTFQVYKEPEMQQWAPALFHNFHDDDAMQNERAVDVGLRTSAFPVSFPMYQGYIDGGVYANNPSMCALAMILRDAREQGDVNALESVAMLSVGCGMEPRSLPVKNGDWGYQEWLLQRHRPLSFVEVVLDSSPMIVDFQCNELIGKHGYYRLNPPLTEARPIKGKHNPDGSAIDRVRGLAKAIGETTDLTSLNDWLDTSHWSRPGSYQKVRRLARTAAHAAMQTADVSQREAEPSAVKIAAAPVKSATTKKPKKRASAH